MAICTFRADAFGFGSDEAIDLQKFVEFLEKAEREGLAKDDLDPAWVAFFDSSKERGLVGEAQGKYYLRTQGRELLHTCRALLAQGQKAEEER